MLSEKGRVWCANIDLWEPNLNSRQGIRGIEIDVCWLSGPSGSKVGPEVGANGWKGRSDEPDLQDAAEYGFPEKVNGQPTWLGGAMAVYGGGSSSLRSASSTAIDAPFVPMFPGSRVALFSGGGPDDSSCSSFDEGNMFFQTLNERALTGRLWGAHFF